MKPTIICNGHQMLSGKQYFHAQEMSPSVLSDELLDYWLDHKLAIELDSQERRSLHRLFPKFSGAECEAEPLDKELRCFAI